MIIQKPTPNLWLDRKGFRPELIVIHIMGGSLKGTDSWFASPLSQVSAHYGVGITGEIHQYVQEEQTAWHAGRVQCPTAKFYRPGINPNLYSIGIEHEGFADSTWSKSQKQASASLIAAIARRWNIPLDRDHVIGHYELYEGKPNCPAVCKEIIDDLILLANAEECQPVPDSLILQLQIKILQTKIAIIQLTKGRDPNINQKGNTKMIQRFLEISELHFNEVENKTVCEGTIYDRADDGAITIKGCQKHYAPGKVETPEEAVAFGKTLLGDSSIEVVYSEHINPAVIESIKHDFTPDVAEKIIAGIGQYGSPTP